MKTSGWITRCLAWLAPLCVWPSTGWSEDVPDPGFERMKQQARALAAAPHVPKSGKLDPYWENLNYDQHRDIRFKMESGLWYGKDSAFSIDFFHPGWTARQTVGVAEENADGLRPLVFDPSLFDYGKNTIPEGTPPPPGYAGWRARCHLNSADYMDEFLVFLGASYFRAIPAHAPYGLSARGLSINSGLPGVPEEFPHFTQFELVKPAAGENRLVARALLEGESVAGAYRFEVTPGETTVMDIHMEITLRRPVKQLGLAPFSSMFWFGESTHPRPYDFRPEVHDSDGLQMELADGTRNFRPLEHTKDQFRHCVFALENPRSWSLLQRDRQFHSYEDPEARYHERPSVRVEPVSGFGKGKLHLIELPTDDETEDNVVLLWEPEPALAPGQPASFHYRLHWFSGEPPGGGFSVKATRCGHPVQRPEQVLLTVDFSNPLQAMPKTGDPKWHDITGWKPELNLSPASVKVVHSGLKDISMQNVDSLPAGLGRSPTVHMPQVLRAFFVLEPGPEVREMDMNCELRDAAGNRVSERWMYLWRK